MKFYLKITLLLFLSASCSQIVYTCQGVDPTPTRITINADEDDFWAQHYFPYGSAEFGSAEKAFMSWDRVDEGDVSYYDGYLYFYTRNEREQLDEAGVKDTVTLALTYDYEALRVTGSFESYTITTMDPDKYQSDGSGGWINYARPYTYSRSATEVVCETWLDFPIDIELNPDSPNMAEKTFDVDVTYKARVKRYGNPPEKAVDKYEEKTATVRSSVTFRVSFNIYGGKVYPNIGFWSNAGADYSTEPSFSGSFECSDDPCSAITVEYQQENKLMVSGPETIAAGDDQVTFDLSGDVEAESYTWTVSYLKPDDSWGELEPVELGSIQPLVLNADSVIPVTKLSDLLYQHGEEVGDVKELSMKVSVKANTGGEPVQSNEHMFKVRVGARPLSIGGPTKISSKEDIASPVVFTASWSGEGESTVRWLDWYFYYKDEQGAWTLADNVNIDGGVQGIEVPWYEDGLCWDAWAEMAGYHGEDVDDKKVLEMKAVAKAVSYSEVAIAESLGHLFTVEYTKSFSLSAPKKMMVFPAGSNQTKVVLSYGTLELSEPIKFEVSRKPHFIDVEFKPESVETNIHGVSETVMKISTNSAIDEPLLPTTGLLVIKASSGGVEAFADIELYIVPNEWLVMYYSCTDTQLSLQNEDEEAIIELVSQSSGSDEARVGTIVMVELEKDWMHQAMAPTKPFDLRALTGRNTYLLKIREGNVTLMGEDGLGQMNMGSGGTLKQFVESSMDSMPSKMKVLVVSDHGLGVRGVVLDESPRDKILVDELRDALEMNPVDVLILDACYMGQLEVLYELHRCADYIVASEIKLPEKGIDYSEIMKQLTIDRYVVYPEFLAKSVVETFKPKPNKDQQLAAIDTSKLPVLVQATSQLADKGIELFTLNRELAYEVMSTTLTLGFNAIEIKNPKGKPDLRGHPYYDLSDLADLIQLSLDLEIIGAEEAMLQIDYYSQEVVRLVDEAVIENKAQLDQSVPRLRSSYKGISVFFWPGYTFSIQKKVLKDYEGYLLDTKFMKETNWYMFVQNFLVEDAEDARIKEEAKKLVDAYQTALDNLFIALSHPQHELYPHLYDSEGQHVGVNPDHWSRTAVDLDIPGSFYYDFGNGTKIISVPPDEGGYTFVVDGVYMEEEIEDYSVKLVVSEGNEQVSASDISEEIEAYTRHSLSVDISDNQITLGDITVETVEAEEEGSGSEDEEESRGIPAAPAISIILGFMGFYVLSNKRHRPT